MDLRPFRYEALTYKNAMALIDSWNHSYEIQGYVTIRQIKEILKIDRIEPDDWRHGYRFELWLNKHFYICTTTRNIWFELVLPNAERLW